MSQSYGRAVTPTAERIWADSVFFVCVLGAALLYLLWRVPTPEFFLNSQDQNGQIAVGVDALAGRIPSVDTFTIYGPLVGMTSALGLWLSRHLPGSPILLGEILICAAGYALTIALLASVVQRLTRPLFGILCAAFLLLLFPRFYKWYYWFWPVLTFVVVEGVLVELIEDRLPRLRLSIWGVASGIGFLYRYDLGLVAACFAAGMLFLTHWSRGSPSAVRATLHYWIWFAGGLALPFLGWIIFWSLARGSLSWLPISIEATLAISRDVVDAYSIPPFQFGMHGIFIRQNVLPTLQVTLPIFYAVNLVYGVWCARRSKGQLEDLMFVAVALAGLGLLPQAYHRAEAQHLLQAIWPAPTLLMLVFGRARRREYGPLILAVPMAFLLAALSSDGGMDYPPPTRNWRADWARLTHLPDSMPTNPVANIAIALRQRSRAEDSIFVAAPWTYAAIVVQSQRHITGQQPFYTPHILTSPEWLARDESNFRAAPPTLLVVPSATWLSAPSKDLAPYNSEVIERWRHEYNVIVHDNGQFRLLRRP